MTELYVNNFRGFRDTFIPLDKVNFLIGENSTGKTSILKLIRVLSDKEFWYNFDLNACGFHFGHFNELCDKDFFEIAAFTYNQNELHYSGVQALKIRYENFNGVIKMAELKFANNDYDVIVKFTHGYHIAKCTYEIVNAFTDKNSLKKWVNDSSSKSKIVHLPLYRPEGLQINVIHSINDVISEDNTMDTTNNLREMIDSFLKNLLWLAPIRVEPQSVYSNYKVNFSPDGSHIPFLLKNLLPTPQSNGKERNTFQAALNKFGQDSGLFDKIEVKILGDEQTSPIEIRVFFGENSVKISNVGYGVSQILPLIIEVLEKEKDMWYAIQQPEIHLHPRGQAAFGELIYDTQKADNKTFIIETHSDYIVDRFRLCVNKDKGETSDEFQVLFFERTKDGNKVTPIKIQSNGKYADDQPKSFQEFFIKEQLELIKI